MIFRRSHDQLVKLPTAIAVSEVDGRIAATDEAGPLVARFDKLDAIAWSPEQRQARMDAAPHRQPAESLKDTEMAMQTDRDTPAQTVEDILITDALSCRPGQALGRQAGEAFVALAQIMANAPHRLPQALCDIALELCDAGTAGISLIRRRPDGEEYFHWEALTGVYAGYLGGTTPRHLSLSGTSVDRAATQLFSNPRRLYSYLDDLSPAIVEALVVPFYASGRPMGSIWVLSHDERQFNASQAHVMEELGAFCGAAFYLLGLKQQAEDARSVLEKEVGELRAADSQLQENLQQAGLTNGILTEANKVKDEFLSLISHELRSPIATIYGNARLLRNRSYQLAGADVDQSLRDIEVESLRLTRIVEDLLVLARPENGGPPREPVRVNATLRTVIADHKKRYPDRQIDLAEESDHVLAVGSDSYLDQIARNLLGNAEKYSPPAERIQVSVSTDGEAVLVIVRDHGGGVAASETDDIFQPFYRSDSALEKASGIGIGLTVCRRLVEAQGGKIWVQAADGGGAEFCFTLPAYTVPVGPSG